MRALSLTWPLCWLAWASCSPVECAPGELRAGSACIELDAGDSDSDAQADASVSDCDACGHALEAPMLQGTPSAAPANVVWTWNTPAGASSFELQLDNQPLPSSSETRLALALEVGSHTLRVRACADAGPCSAWSSFTTQVESFGEGYGKGLYATKRAFARTPLKRAAAVACNDCALDAAKKPLGVPATLAKLTTVLSRQADVIDLDIAFIQERLLVTGSDPAQSGGSVPLDELLTSPQVRSGSALIALEVAERKVSVNQLSEALLAIFQQTPELMQNGRPLLLRCDRTRLPYARAVRKRLEEQLPLQAPYLRIWLDEREPPAFSSWRDEIPQLLDGIDGVLLDYRVDDLFGRLAVLRQQGVSVGIGDVPGPGHGEVVLAALREEVDLFFTDYRVDQARTIVSEIGSGVYATARALTPGMPLPVYAWAADGQVSEVKRTLGGSAPGLVSWGAGFPLLGGVLDFSPGNRSLLLSDSPLPRSQGAVFSLVGRLTDLLDLETSTTERTWLGSPLDVIGDVSLGASPSAARMVSFLGRTQASGVTKHDVPYGSLPSAACDSRNGSLDKPISATGSAWLAGTMTVSPPSFTLLVNGRCAYTTSSNLSGIPRSPALHTLMLGAKPSGVAGGAPSDHSKSYFQTVQVLAWRNHAADESN